MKYHVYGDVTSCRQGGRLQLTFYGVRGSCPCPCEANMRYGGNTACVALEVDGEPPIVLDLGTGLRAFGEHQPLDGSFRGTALVTHSHWDHVQGLPFFPPAARVGAEFDTSGPAPDGRSHHDPSHDDPEIDRLLEGARRTASGMGRCEVSAAAEGLRITL